MAISGAIPTVPMEMIVHGCHPKIDSRNQAFHFAWHTSMHACGVEWTVYDAWTLLNKGYCQSH